MLPDLLSICTVLLQISNLKTFFFLNHIYESFCAQITYYVSPHYNSEYISEVLCGLELVCKRHDTYTYRCLFL